MPMVIWIFDPEEVGGSMRQVYYPAFKQILDEAENEEELREKLSKSIAVLIPRHIIVGRYVLLRSAISWDCAMA